MHAAAVWCALGSALLGHALLWTGTVNRLHGLRGPRLLIKLLTVLCVAAFAAAPLAVAAWFWQAGSLGANPFAAAGWVRPYVSFCAVLGVVGLAVKLWVEASRCDRRILLQWTNEPRDVAKALGKAPLVGAYARALGRLPGNEALSLSVDRKRLALPGLPTELDGLTIAHLSDLHMTGRVGREYYRYAMRVVNDLRPDVIAITGDIVENAACVPWLAGTLGTLCAPLGVYFILGNHDLFIDSQATRAELTEAGLVDLGGRWLRAQWNGARVVMVGNELPWIGTRAALGITGPTQSGEPAFRLALCHTPDQFSWCVAAEVDLALAGHTHGGQVQLPIVGVVGSPSIHGTRYACGVFRRGGTVLHVTRGLGGQTPWRWRCPPEIALLELRGAKG
ncbi:MAG TPA: metallophosphoesterase [Lacipirellulaceae bacterium]|nr:metallophosphoesterase [Lacipirellulaceae bacterium]